MQRHMNLAIVLLLIVAALIIVLPATSPSAHSGATGVVKERMESMERQEELIERIFAMLRGELPYNQKAVQSAAREIKETAGQHLVKLFPKGSNQKPSKALPAIWTNFDQFSHMAERLRDFAATVEANAGATPPQSTSLPKKWEQVPTMGSGMGQGANMGRGGSMMGQGMMGQGMMGQGGNMGPGGGMMSGGNMPNQGRGVESDVWRLAHMCNSCHANFRKSE